MDLIGIREVTWHHLKVSLTMLICDGNIYHLMKHKFHYSFNIHDSFYEKLIFIFPNIQDTIWSKCYGITFPVLNQSLPD